MLVRSFKTTVLLHEVVNSLNIVSDGIYVDGTFGQGGHSRVILSLLGPKGRLLAIDRDRFSVNIGESIERQDARFTMIHGRFSELFKHLKYYNLLGRVNGILLDLGLSRLQLENSSRGFSFINNGPLDMRMDTSSALSAELWLCKASLEKITWVLRNYGEERFARKLAKSIVIYRKKNRLKYTNELVQLIIDSIPWYDKYKHPATRTFQAIRIYVNNELEEIKAVLKDILFVLAPGGRLSVISFHSLEDRIVKSFIHQSLPVSMFDKTCFDTNSKYYFDSKDIFVNKSINISRNKCYLKLIGRIFPSKKEVKDNISARSAVLRCVEKVVV